MDSNQEQPIQLNNKLLTYFIDQAKLHGLTFILMAIAVWYFEKQNSVLNDELKACTDAVISVYRTDRAQLLDVVSNNTAALERIKILTQ